MLIGTGKTKLENSGFRIRDLDDGEREGLAEEVSQTSRDFRLRFYLPVRCFGIHFG
jgi:hypothetical protein